MNSKHLQIFCIALTTVYIVFVGWVYWAAPKNLGDITIKARETVESAASKARVVTNTYEIDREKFNEGLKAFRADNFVRARDFFARADKENRDPNTQFYIAYSFYRQGWGRFANDDELFTKGLEMVKKLISMAPDFETKDPDLKLRTPAELKNELEEGLRVTADDFNPLKVMRERK